MIKLIIDTDIGDDVDDALALAFALNCPELDILGVTTVYKNTVIRAELAAKLLALYGKSHIPAVPGIGQPLAEKVDVNEVPVQCRTLDKCCHNRSDQFAVDFIINTVKENPGLNIVTIGALTNIAACIRKAPEVMKDCQLTIMGGITKTAYPESNIASDPEAAKIVFEADVPINLVSLDVTLKCSLSFNSIMKIRNRGLPQTNFLYKLINIWKEEILMPLYKSWTISWPENGEYGAGMHDPMTIAFVCMPFLFEIKKTYIAVETIGEYTRGVTVERLNVFNDYQPIGYNTDLAIDVQAEKFMKLFISRILK